MANPRTLARIAARIKERVAHALEFEVADPRSGFVTITDVEVTKDLSIAKISYSVLGTPADRNKVAHMLEGARGFLQSKMARVLKTRRLPRIVWAYDESIEYAANMDRLISDAKRRDEEIHNRGFANDPAPAEDWEQEYEEFTEGADDAPPPA